MKKYTLLLLLIAVSVLMAQGQQANYCIANRFSENAFFDSSEIRIDSNVSFATVKNYFTNAVTTLKMDVFYPDKNLDSLSSRPFILLIHGGAFLAGNRTEMNYKCMELARRGFVTATMDYRLGWSCSGTDFLSICVACGSLNSKLQTATYCAVQDAKAAMRYINANATTYDIDTSKLFIGGESAGSITALHTTFWTQAEANVFIPTAVSQVGLLDTSGNQLPGNYTIKGVINFCGAVTKDSIVLNKGNIPVINFADEFDCVVPPGYGQVISCLCQVFYWEAGSAAIYGMLTRNGICSEYHQVPASLNHCSFPALQLVRNSSCFLKRVMCNSCQSSFSTQPNAAISCSQLSGIENHQPGNNPSFSFSNPVQNELTVTFEDPIPIKKGMYLIITDLLGKILIRKDCKESILNIETGRLPAGSYLITLNDGENRTTKKLVVMK